MASNTPNLNLYKKDPTIDGNDTFNIKTMLNDNWDKIDTEVAKKANQSDFNTHLRDTISHITQAERTTWNGKAEKTYVDEQIQTVTATGIPKLVSYEYDLYATTDNQTVFTIPYDYFNSTTDTLMVEISGIDVPKSYYTVTNPISNSDKSITKGYITLTEGRPKDSFLKMRILKNVPIGSDGAIQGTVMAIDSIPQNRVQGLVDLNNNFVSHKADNTKHLGGLCQTFSGDLNNLYTATGSYMGNDLINAPTTDWYYVEVFVHRADSTGWCLQRITNFNDDRYCWTRERRNGTWSAWNCLFQYANDGKTAVANAVTAKGVSASPSDTFSALATKIGQINTGKKWASGTFTFDSSCKYSINGLNFVPYIIETIQFKQGINYSHGIFDLDIWSNRNTYGTPFDYVFYDGGFTISITNSNWTGEVIKWRAYEQ